MVKRVRGRGTGGTGFWGHVKEVGICATSIYIIVYIYIYTHTPALVISVEIHFVLCPVVITAFL